MANAAHPSGFSNLADNLRILRLAQRLTQHQLAERAGEGFSQTYVCRLERGLRPSDPKHTAVLANALCVPLDALLRPFAPLAAAGGGQ